jgi:hypothetical protein
LAGTRLVLLVGCFRTVIDLCRTSRTQAAIKIKQALVGLAEKPNELLTLLPLTPLMPKRLARRLAGMALSTADLPIGCSNIGDVDAAINRPDGTDADYISMRLIDPGIK